MSLAKHRPAFRAGSALSVRESSTCLSLQRRGSRRLSLYVTFSLLLALLLATPALAKDQEFGYNGKPTSGGMDCSAGQPCAAYVESSPSPAWDVVPVTGKLTQFTLAHTLQGAGQTATLLVLNDVTKEVVAESAPQTLSNSKESETFPVTPIAVMRGESLAVAVTPGLGQAADNIVAPASYEGAAVADCTPPLLNSSSWSCAGSTPSGAIAVKADVEDAIRPPYVVANNEVSKVEATSAEMHAIIMPDDPPGHTTMARFEYGTAANNLDQVTSEMEVPGGEGGAEDDVNISAIGLKPNTTYYYRVGVSNYEAATNSGWEYGHEEGHWSEVKSFTTPSAPPPTVTLSEATNVGETAATIDGSVASNGLTSKWKFEYGESLGYGSVAGEGEVGSGSGATPQAVSVNLASLKPNTLYHYRLVATNPGGTTPSADGTFRTAAGKPPVVGALVFSPLTPLTSYEVNLHFTVDPQGYATTFVIQWGTTTAYGNSDPSGPTSAVFGPQAYFWDAEYELSPATTYHVRVVATNQWGTTTGPDFTFTTPPLTPLFLFDEFGIPVSNSTVPVSLAKPILVLGKKFSCPPACSVEAEVEAVGKGKKKIKLGKAKFKIPKDKRKHKLEVKLPKKARKLLAKDKKLHLKVKYKIANEKGQSTTIVSSLTLGTSGGHKGKGKRKH